MAPRDEQGSTLSAHRAFVVHLGTGGGPGRRRFSGRVEHLSSGESMHFSSLKGLLAFFAAALDAAAGAALRGSHDQAARRDLRPSGTRAVYYRGSMPLNPAARTRRGLSSTTDRRTGHEHEAHRTPLCHSRDHPQGTQYRDAPRDSRAGDHGIAPAHLVGRGRRAGRGAAAPLARPLAFEANRGQADEEVKFLARGAGYTVFLTSTDAVLSLRGRSGRAVVRVRPVGASAAARIVADGELARRGELRRP